ncbi:hypothetical protein WJX75_004888 [Coccomyxa subellipsoidea]|uniref:Uncharacterized protein n=1 Tax=Coccomyxa subellipsoidea TaxID=248742 RepID=A0ABR2YIR6_9CHLO
MSVERPNRNRNCTSATQLLAGKVVLIGCQDVVFLEGVQPGAERRGQGLVAPHACEAPHAPLFLPALVRGGSH